MRQKRGGQDGAKRWAPEIRQPLRRQHLAEDRNPFSLVPRRSVNDDRGNQNTHEGEIASQQHTAFEPIDPPGTTKSVREGK